MSKQFANSSLCILTLTIDDCLGCEQEHVRFSKTNNVHLLLYSLDKTVTASDEGVSVLTPVGRALQLVCSMEYASAESLQRMPQLQLGKGSVKMTFSLSRMGGISNQYDPEPESDLDMEPSTSKQAHDRRQRRDQLRQQQRSQRMITYEVTVLRRFDHDVLERVFWQLNSGIWRNMAIGEFHSIFFVQEQHMTPELLRNVHEMHASNWLKVIQADAVGYRNFRDDYNPFETFAKLFERQNYADQELLHKLTTDCLMASETTRLCERRFVLHIFDQVRSIFEYITANEYTVWFFVPRLNSYTTLEQVNVDDFDLRNVRTNITLSTDTSDFHWYRADHNIMDILLIAFQMTLARIAKQSVLILGRLEKLADFMRMQYVKASFMNNIYSSDASSPKWIYPCYLHRIIEAAESLGLIVFIEYPSGLTLLPSNRQVIRCVQEREGRTGAIAWKLYNDVTKHKENAVFQFLKKVVHLE